MATAGTVNVKFKADTANFTAGVARASERIGNFSKVLGGIAAVAATAFAWKATGYVKEALSAIDATAKMSDQLGITTESLIAMQHAGNLAGVSTEEITKSMQRMGVSLEDAKIGGKLTADAFHRLGINLSEFSKLKPDQQFEATAIAINKLGSESEKAYVANSLFGKSGLVVKQLFKDSSTAISDARRETEKYGTSLSRLDAAKVELVNDSFTRVSSVLTGVWQSVTIKLTPVLLGISEQFLLAAESSQGFGETTDRAILKTIESVGVFIRAMAVIESAYLAVKVALSTLAFGFVDILNKIYHGVQFIIGAIGNVFLAVYDSASALGDAVAAAMAVGKKHFADFSAGVSKGFSDLLFSVAGGLAFIDEGLSNSLKSSAQAIADAAKNSGDTAREEIQRTQEAAEFSANRAKESWSNVFNVETKDNEALGNLFDSAHAVAEQAAVDLSIVFDSVATRAATTGAEIWLSQMREKIEVLSAKIANATAERQNAIPEQGADANFNPETSVTQALMDEYGLQRENAETHSNWMTDLWKDGEQQRLDFEKQTGAQKLQFVGDNLSKMGALMNTHSKRAFTIGKIAALAGAIVSTAAGAANALYTTPYPYNLLAVASVIAAGAVQIATISRTQFNGGGSAPTSSGGGGTVYGGDPKGVAIAGVTGNSTNNMNINITGLPEDAMVSGAFVRQLIERINEVGSDGTRINANAVNVAMS